LSKLRLRATFVNVHYGPRRRTPREGLRPRRAQIAVSVPPRDYHLAARLLADATDGHTRRALAAAAERLGREIAAEGPAAELAPLLQERGYEPVHDEHGVVRLRNCPFHAVAQRHPEIVCEMNLALLGGLVDGLDSPGLSATLEPGTGRCCVALRQPAASER
jgi:predicted ArsR family transcriptional regulator